MPDRVFLFMPTISKICSGSLLVFSAVTAACGGAPVPHVNPEPDPRVLPAVGEQAPDISELYRQIGLIAAPNPVAFVGKVSAFASKTPDTTLLLVSISLPNRALTFTREGDRYRAPYEVSLSLNRGDAPVASVNVMEIVRVGSFREINRSDESVIFQHYFHVQPGNYTLSTMVRDVGGSRNATQQTPVTVPPLGAGHLSTPVQVF